MKKYFGLFAVFALFLIIVSIEANAATFSNIFKYFSKNSTSQKTITVTSDKSLDAKTEDKTILEKESAEKDTSILSKEDMDIKSKTLTKTGTETKDAKTSEKTREFSKEFDKTQTKSKITNDGKLKVDVKQDSVCVSLSDQAFAGGETQPPQVTQKQYEFRSGVASCRGGLFSSPTDDAVVEIVECNKVELKAKCREGFVLNYGASCNYGEGIDIDNRGIEQLYAIPSFFNNEWGSLPASREVFLRCNSKLDIDPGRGLEALGSTDFKSVEKSLYITCVREKN